MVVLVGIGALALDVGRLFVLRSQMQNGVDSAALSAAAELSRSGGAQARADTAARNALDYASGISEVSELLGANISLEFFCAIGSAADPSDPVVTGNYCTATPVVENGITRWPAVGDADSHYVRVTMDQSVTSDAYSIPLFFLPVLNLFGMSTDTQSFLQARAMAGRNYFYCEYPPMMLCNPFEDNSPPQNFQDAMNEGETIILADQGPSSSWTPGNFAFLALLGTTGAEAAADYLADEGVVGCTPPIITTEPGQMTQRTENAIDTRFDLYSNPGFAGAWNSYPPASNVIDYPRDLTYRAGDPRFGNGDWDRDLYWNTYHGWRSPGYGKPPDYNDLIDPTTRYEMYQWEIDNSHPPVRDPGLGSCDTTSTRCDGIPDPTHNPSGQTPERRVFNVAVANCVAQGISGRQTFTIFGQEGFAKIFLTEQALGPPNREIIGEYIEWAAPGGDSNVHVDVQLYE